MGLEGWIGSGSVDSDFDTLSIMLCCGSGKPSVVMLRRLLLTKEDFYILSF